MIETLGEATSVASVNLIYSTGDPLAKNGRMACFCLSVCSVNLVAYRTKVLQISMFITFLRCTFIYSDWCLEIP